ncbi:MAG: hypothetical protein II628_08440, partial [Lachnospiraceae bacterium]|nr:hypothetical protein [Lachnospiraceae bacterium]
PEMSENKDEKKPRGRFLFPSHMSVDREIPRHLQWKQAKKHDEKPFILPAEGKLWECRIGTYEKMDRLRLSGAGGPGPGPLDLS